MSILTRILEYVNPPHPRRIGDYRVKRQLGSGQFGTVYLAVDPKDLSREQVAIKVFQNAKNAVDISGFKKEASALLGFSHPHIVKVLVFHYDGAKVPYLVMTYFSDGDLKSYLQCHPPLPLTDIVTYIQNIASALQYSHDRNIIHRDVKPSNMLRGPNGEILLSDFGIATHLDDNGEQTSTNIIGTLSYMAPEQLAGKATRASDQYSLAVVAYELLCGTLPYRRHIESIIAEIRNEAMPSFVDRDNNPVKVPKKIKRVICKALEKKQENRYHSVQEFAYKLTEAYKDYIANEVTDLVEVSLSQNGVIETPPSLQPALPSLRERAIMLSTYLFSVFLLASGWGASIGILLHSWLLAAGVAPLIGATFYARARKQGINTLSATSIKNTMRNVVLWLAFFLFVILSSFAASSMTFSLSVLAYNTIDLNGMAVGLQIYLGLFAGIIITLLVGIALAWLPRKDEYSWLHLLIFSLLFGLTILQIPYWLHGLGISSLKSATSLLVGVIALTGTITLFKIRKKL